MPTRDLLESFGLKPADPNRLTFLCGAGISYAAPTRLPTVAAFVERVLDHCTADTALSGRVLSAMRREAPTQPRFEVLVNSFVRLGIDPVSIGRVFDSASPNVLHSFLSQQCESGAVVLTTNFDNCIERSSIRRLARVVFDGTDLESLGPSNAVIVKPHGSNRLREDDPESSLIVSIAALARTARGFAMFPNWRSYLESLLTDRTVVVVGYSGSDDFDITPVLKESKPAQMLWVDYIPESTMYRAESSGASQNVRTICDHLGAIYVRGDLARRLSGGVPAPNLRVAPASVVAWLDAVAPSDDIRQTLLCTLLRHFGLHEDTIEQTRQALSPEALVQRGTALYYRGRYKEARTVLESASNMSLSDRQKCETLYLLSSAAFYDGDLDRARNDSDRHVFLAEELADVGELQTALVNAAALDFSAGARDLARARYERVVSLQDLAPSLQPAAMAEWGLADLASTDGDLDEAVRRYSTAHEICRQLGSVQGLAWTGANLAEVLVRKGDWEMADAQLAEAEALFEAQGVAAGSLQALGCRARLEYRRGQLAAAEVAVSRSAPLLAAHGESAAMLILIPVAYLLAADLRASQTLESVREATAGAVVRAVESHREGTSATQWVLCQQVIESFGVDEDLYARCHSWVVGAEVASD